MTGEREFPVEGGTGKPRVSEVPAVAAQKEKEFAKQVLSSRMRAESDAVATAATSGDTSSSALHLP